MPPDTSRNSGFYIPNREQVTQRFILSYVHKHEIAHFSELHKALYYASATFRYSDFGEFGFEDFFDDNLEDNTDYLKNDLIRSMLMRLSEGGLIEILNNGGRVISLTKKGRRLVKDGLFDKSALQDAIDEALGPHPIDFIPL